MRLAHQVDANRELEALLKLAMVRHLLPLAWSIGEDGDLTGLATTGNPDERAAAIVEWAAALRQQTMQSTDGDLVLLTVWHPFSRGQRRIRIETTWPAE
jgi:hypothetical protein